MIAPTFPEDDTCPSVMAGHDRPGHVFDETLRSPECNIRVPRFTIMTTSNSGPDIEPHSDARFAPRLAAMPQNAE